MKLQIIFLSDLLELLSNIIKEYYWEGKKDKFSRSNYRWPIIKPDNKVTIIWRHFLQSISTQNWTLSSYINTTYRPNIYRLSITYLFTQKDILALD